MAQPDTRMMHVMVCHAAPDEIFLESLDVAHGTTLGDAIRASGVLQAFPQLDLGICRVGVFGKLRSLDTAVQPGDRIEIYRPLIADPKAARQRRVAHKRAAGSNEGLKWRRGQS
ncbi:MAG TPA: RnfH family protein [Burkholderiaceae bacterium]|nr:RnfH family protein [Burkholderiaceae bacterium]